MTKDDIIALGKQLEAEDDAAHDLWTWLPSYKIAEERHGDYAYEVRPDMVDLLKEAALVFAKNAEKGAQNRALTEEERSYFEQCPCGALACGEPT